MFDLKMIFKGHFKLIIGENILGKLSKLQITLNPFLFSLFNPFVIFSYTTNTYQKIIKNQYISHNIYLKKYKVKLYLSYTSNSQKH